MAGAEGKNFQQFLAKSYLLEPQYTDEKLRQMDADRDEAARVAAAQPQEREWTGSTWWCGCGRYRVMSTQLE